jgi:hypothetical protein
MFFLCLADMTYGFYQLVRFAGLIGFVILAFKAKQYSRQTEVVIYCGLAFLFQPFLKVALGRQIWNIIDLIVGLGLLFSIFQTSKSQCK